MSSESNGIRRAATLLAVTSLLVLMGLAGVAQARPLKLSELNEFNTWVQCSEACPGLPPAPTYEQQRNHFQCRAACGNAVRRWEKNGVEPIDRDDLELAILETQHAQQPPDAPLVCYRGEAAEVVVRGPLCAEEVCQNQPPCSPEQCQLPEAEEMDCTEDEHGPRCWWPAQSRPPACPDIVCESPLERDEATCTDTDGDGVPAWLEERTGGSDLQASTFCGGLTPCALDQRCLFDEEVGGGLCDARDCNDGCPLFHLPPSSIATRAAACCWIGTGQTWLPVRSRASPPPATRCLGSSGRDTRLR